jgi:TATA-binding protein-associated factor Taf7
MENTFNLKKFLAEGKLLKEEQENKFYDEDGNLDTDILLNFIQNTLTSKGYNIPEEIWDDMAENAASGDMFDEDEEGEYENFSEQDAYEEVEKYIKMLRNFSNSSGYEFMEFPEYFKNMSIEDFKN